jgi:hypothetical protein
MMAAACAIRTWLIHQAVLGLVALEVALPIRWECAASNVQGFIQLVSITLLLQQLRDRFESHDHCRAHILQTVSKHSATMENVQ